MKLAWAILVLAAILTFGVFLILVDLVSTKIANGSVYDYEEMAIALVLFVGSGSFRRIRLQPHQ